MKEKLLQLIYACINDEDMFSHKYVNDRQYLGINERIDQRITSSIDKIELKGVEIKKNDPKYDFGMEIKSTYADYYELAIGFGNEPQLTITAVLKGNDKSQKQTIIQSIGTRNYYLCKIPKRFDITLVTDERHYEMRCGSYAFILSDELVKEIYDKIKAKRFDIANKVELATINERFDTYQIK